MRSLTLSLGLQLMVDIIRLVPQQELELASVSNGEEKEKRGREKEKRGREKEKRGREKGRRKGEERVK